MAQHALVTGPITGRIPTPDKALDGDWLDVTPEVLLFDTPEQVQAAAEAIGIELAVRGTHPIQAECEVLRRRDEIHPGGLSFSDETVKAHQDAHKALNKKAGL